MKTIDGPKNVKTLANSNSNIMAITFEPLEPSLGYRDFFVYKGQLVYVHCDKIEIGKKSFFKNVNDRVFCANGLLLVEGYEPKEIINGKSEPVGDFGIYTYEDGQFVKIDCVFTQNQYREFFAKDIYCIAEYDVKDESYKVVFNDRGTEYSFVNECNSNLFAFFFNTKHQVLAFIHHDFYIFFTKTGKELWYLERNENFQMMFDVDAFDPDSDILIIKLTENNRHYSVCYNILTGEVMWKREDNHSLSLTGVKCHDGLYRGLLGYGQDTLLFEMNPLNGETNIFTLKEGGKCVKFEGILNDLADHYFLYTLNGDRLYFVKNYKNYLVGDNRTRTVGVVDLQTMSIFEEPCLSYFSTSGAPIIHNDILYVFFNQPRNELFRFAISTGNDQAVKNKTNTKQPLSGNYVVLLQGDFLVYVFEYEAFVVNLTTGRICQRFIADNSKYTPQSSIIVDGKLCLVSSFANGSSDIQTERKEYVIDDVISEELDDRVNVDLVEILAHCCDTNLDRESSYKLFFYKNKVYVISKTEIIIIDLGTKSMQEKIVPKDRSFYPESSYINGNMLCLYSMDKVLGMCYYSLDDKDPFHIMKHDRFNPENSSEQCQLAYYYSIGEAGVPKDDSKAVYWYTQSAKQGHLIAQIELAKRYESGNGVPQDDKQALYWRICAAKQGDKDSCFIVAECFANGRIVEKDMITAVRWYLTAAKKGSKEASEVIERLENEMCIELTYVYANSGKAEAQFELGLRYETGYGIRQSVSKALMWYEKAAILKYDKAIEAFERLTPRINDAYLGEIVYRGQNRWRGETTSNFCGKKTEMTILLEGSVDGISSSQHLTYAEYLVRKGNFYKDVMAKVREVFGDKISKDDFVNPEVLFIDQNGNYGWVCSKSWDEYYIAAILSDNDIKLTSPYVLYHYSDFINSRTKTEWHVGDTAYLYLFGILEGIPVERALYEYKHDEDEEIRKGKLTDREVELVKWLTTEFDIASLDYDIVDYCNNRYEMWCDKRIEAKDLYDELTLKRIYLRTEHAKNGLGPDISITGDCECDDDHGIAIGFKDKDFYGIGDEALGFD